MRREWTTTELRIVRDNIWKQDKELAVMLNRSTISVKKARRYHGLMKFGHQLNKDQIAAIKSSTESNRILSKRYGISTQGINWHRR